MHFLAELAIAFYLAVNGLLGMQGASEDASIASFIAGSERLNTFSDLLAEAGMDRLLDSGEFTVFAPSDGAFAKLQSEIGQEAYDALLSGDSSVTLEFLLNSHIIEGRYTESDLQDHRIVATLQGNEVPIYDGGRLFAGWAVAEGPAADLSNGTVFIIDTVAVPFRSDIPPGADAKTYAYDKDTRIGKDIAQVWVRGEMPPEFHFLSGADPETFHTVGRPYYKDKNRAYCWHHPLPLSVDIDTFALAPFDSAMQAHPSNIHSRYAVDKNAVYFCDSVVAGADVATFRTVEMDGFGGDARDANHTYRWGKIVE